MMWSEGYAQYCFVILMGDYFVERISMYQCSSQKIFLFVGPLVFEIEVYERMGTECLGSFMQIKPSYHPCTKYEGR